MAYVNMHRAITKLHGNREAIAAYKESLSKGQTRNRLFLIIKGNTLKSFAWSLALGQNVKQNEISKITEAQQIQLHPPLSRETIDYSSVPPRPLSQCVP